MPRCIGQRYDIRHIHRVILLLDPATLSFAQVALISPGRISVENCENTRRECWNCGGLTAMSSDRAGERGPFRRINVGLNGLLLLGVEPLPPRGEILGLGLGGSAKHFRQPDGSGMSREIRIRCEQLSSTERCPDGPNSRQPLFVSFVGEPPVCLSPVMKP